MLEVGKPFPNFRLANQDGQQKELSSYSGKWLVVFVYPKDDTPGCTLESKGFSAMKTEFEREGVTVVGLSEDDVSSHKNFCNKFSLTVDLLADPKKELLTAANVGQSDYKGTMYWDRTTFTVDPRGVLRKIYLKVKPEGHDQAVLGDIKAMKASL